MQAARPIERVLVVVGALVVLLIASLGVVSALRYPPYSPSPIAALSLLFAIAAYVANPRRKNSDLAPLLLGFLALLATAGLLLAAAADVWTTGLALLTTVSSGVLGIVLARR